MMELLRMKLTARYQLQIAKYTHEQLKSIELTQLDNHTTVRYERIKTNIA